jgi:hypothetical protein
MVEVLIGVRHSAYLAAISDGHFRRGDGQVLARLVVWVRSTAHVPDLAEENGPLVLDGLGDGFPSLHLLIGEYARGARVAETAFADHSSLADHQPTARGALRIVLDSQSLRDRVEGATAGERRIDNAVLELGGADLDGLEEGRGVCRRGGGQGTGGEDRGIGGGGGQKIRHGAERVGSDIAVI